MRCNHERIGRAIACIALVVGAFAASRGSASAETEFCPASVSVAPIPSEPSALYGFNLTALGPRNVTATLALDTSTGWFTVSVPRVSLTEKDRHYINGPMSWSWFGRRDWISPAMYVRFPQPVTIHQAFVSSASATGDPTFGWDAKGNVTCTPPGSGNGRIVAGLSNTGESPSAMQVEPERGSSNGTPHTGGYSAAGSNATTRTPTLVHPLDTHATAFFVLDSRDKDDLSAAPAQSSTVIQAMPVPPVETAAGCAQPFADVAGKRLEPPVYPVVNHNPGIVKVIVAVAVDTDGSIVDSYLWGPSGIQPFDDAALSAAQRSAYAPARAYCQPVPGLFLYMAMFDPNA